MKLQTNILTLILLSFISCQGNNNKSSKRPENEKTIKLKNEKDISSPGEHFAKIILGTNLGKKSIRPFELENLNYSQLFSKKGITQFVAYYDKTINQLKQPKKFEEFLLFVASYDNSNNAISAFERIKSDAALSNSSENIEEDLNIRNRIELLRLEDKYGGLITYNGNQVFSLIENCDKLPKEKSWLELEYTFTDLMKNENGKVEVLKAGCEEGRYYGGLRKASS